MAIFVTDVRYVESRGRKGSNFQRQVIGALEKDGFGIDYFEFSNQHRLKAGYDGDVLVLPAAVRLGDTCVINNLETWSPI